MSQWSKLIAEMANQVEDGFDALRRNVGERLGRDEEDCFMIMPYRGYGRADRLYLKGRVLEDEGISLGTAEDSTFRNLINTYKRFESDEVPGAVVRWHFQSIEEEVIADEEGFFDAWVKPIHPLPTGQLWHDVELTLREPRQADSPPVQATGQVLVPPQSAQFGVISDMDDTVLESKATEMIEMARLLLTGNAHTRIAFEGVAAFYQALQAGKDMQRFNPIFYVSSSPWNLYDMLSEFLRLQKIPSGPLMLRDWGITKDELLPTKHGPHKINTIRQILDSYPHLPFILIGDSGQEDPEIYRDIVQRYPNRILAVYIRDVTNNPLRTHAITTIASEIANAGSSLILANHTHDMVAHAQAQGWIAA